jgi:hypothetical protein
MDRRPARAFSSEVDPVRVKKTRQTRNLEPRFDSIETEKALGEAAAATAEQLSGKRGNIFGATKQPCTRSACDAAVRGDSGHDCERLPAAPRMFVAPDPAWREYGGG